MDNQLYRPLETLHNWDKNPRSITQGGFDRLKAQVELLGQYKPLLAMPDGTVLGGNMRLKVYKELGLQQIWVSTIDFSQQDDGLWQAMVNGVLQKKRFHSKEDGMLEYALSDNDRAGYYDEDLLTNLMPEFTINWSEYGVDLSAPATIDTILNKQEHAADETNKDAAMLTCPSCGHQWRPAEK